MLESAPLPFQLRGQGEAGRTRLMRESPDLQFVASSIDKSSFGRIDIKMQHLKDPAAGVAPVLLPHIHLVSKGRYPTTNNPSLESIVSYLSEAPKIVRDVQPMQWQFLDAPADGTLLLVWQPLEYMGTAFASDGYIYADAEQTFKSDVRGFVSPAASVGCARYSNAIAASRDVLPPFRLPHAGGAHGIT